MTMLNNERKIRGKRPFYTIYDSLKRAEISPHHKVETNIIDKNPVIIIRNIDTNRKVAILPDNSYYVVGDPTKDPIYNNLTPRLVERYLNL